MARLVWDATGERKYELGVKKGVLYPWDSGQNKYGTGVAWNGLTNLTQSPEGAEATDLYADDIKYASLRSAETFGGTIECYTYPDEFGECNGEVELDEGVTIGQQERKMFGLSYVTTIGNDVTSNLGYKIHLVYGCTCSPSETSYASLNDSPEASTLSYEFDTTPVNVTDHSPVSHLVLDSTKLSAAALSAIEDKLYGDSSAGTPSLPLPDEVLSIITTADA